MGTAMVLGPAAILLNLVAILLGPALLWGIAQFGLNLHDGRAEIGDLFGGFSIFGKAFVRYFGIGFLTALSALPGAIIYFVLAMTGEPEMIAVGVTVYLLWIFVVPLRLYFVYLFSIDRDMGVMESLSASWNATRGNMLKVFLLGFLASIIYMAGALALLIGILVTLPVAMMMFVSAYRQMAGTPARS